MLKTDASISLEETKEPTDHKLNGRTGADFFVRHYCVELFHAPTQQKIDKAAAKKAGK